MRVVLIGHQALATERGEKGKKKKSPAGAGGGVAIDPSPPDAQLLPGVEISLLRFKKWK